MEAIGFAQIQALARSARTSRVPPIRHNSFGARSRRRGDTYSVWPPPSALDLRASPACGKQWL